MYGNISEIYKKCTGNMRECLRGFSKVPEKPHDKRPRLRHKCARSSVGQLARQHLCTGCGDCEGHSAPVQAGRSFTPLSTGKHSGLN